MAYMSRAPENNSAAAGHGYHGPDLISGLPDELLHHVLTFVPTLDSICTSVLSRRWIDVWTRVPQLILRDEILDIELMTDILSRYAADVYITDLKICYHWDYPQLYEAQVTSWAEFAAQRVTGRVDLSVTTQFETAWPNEFVDLPCFGWATEISIYSSGMAVRLPPPAAVTGGGDEFTRLTRLQMSHLRLSDDGEGISDVVSRRCPRLEILELDHIGDGVYDDVISLSLHSESLQSLRIVSVCCLRRLEVDAANMHEMRVEYCFAESNGPTAMRLSAPAMEVLGWEDKCPNEVELITLPMFLKELFYSEIPDPRSYRVAEILEHFARVGVLRLSLIHRVQLPYCSELDLSVITKQHMSYGSCIIHFLKRNSTIRSLALTLHAYHPEMCRVHKSNSIAAAAGHSYNGPDLISSLPNEIFHHVLIILTTPETIRTSVLSHRWIGVWTQLF
uniref:F-box domain-containing protein n=1 Tax=Leersia perrieri TaxID=77586 RepID=A0A0D9X023_9ORYZ